MSIQNVKNIKKSTNPDSFPKYAIRTMDNLSDNNHPPKLQVSLMRKIKNSLFNNQTPINNNKIIIIKNNSEIEKAESHKNICDNLVNGKKKSNNVLLELLKKKTLITEGTANDRMDTDFVEKYKNDITKIKTLLDEKHVKLRSQSNTTRYKNIILKHENNEQKEDELKAQEISQNKSTQVYRPIRSKSIPKLRLIQKRKSPSISPKMSPKRRFTEASSKNVSPIKKRSHSVIQKRIPDAIFAERKRLEILRSSPTMFTNSNKYYANNYANEIRKDLKEYEFILSDIANHLTESPTTQALPMLKLKRADKNDETELGWTSIPKIRKLASDLKNNKYANHHFGETLDQVLNKLEKLRKIGYTPF